MLPQEAKVYVKWTVAGLASSYVTVNSIFLASSTLDLDQSAVVFFLDNGKKFPASASAHPSSYNISANCRTLLHIFFCEAFLNRAPRRAAWLPASVINRGG